MTDIVERLRAHANTLDWTGAETAAREREAADEIERLRALLQELIDIEGPQPGTAGWAAKVREALTGREADPT